MFVSPYFVVISTSRQRSGADDVDVARDCHFGSVGD